MKVLFSQGAVIRGQLSGKRKKISSCTLTTDTCTLSFGIVMLRTLLLTCLVIFLLSTTSCAGGNAGLIHAAERGDISTVKTLLAKDADVNAKRDIDGWTPLMFASANGHSKVARLLRNAGAR